MGIIDNEEIRGYNVDRETVCCECITAEEVDAAEEGAIILADTLERDSDKTYFCDRCKKRL